MPRRNPREERGSKGWKGVKGRKGREDLYHQVGMDRPSRSAQSLKPGDTIDVLVRSINRRGEGEGLYEGRQVIISGAPDPGLVVRVRVRKIAEGKIFAELVEDERE